MGRAPCCDKVGLKKGPWTPEEDQVLINFIQLHGHSNWRALPKQAGLLRCGKSCRLRWINYLRPDIKRGNFSREEEETIIQLHEMMGNRWSAIAARLPGRTDNEIKNVWHTHLKKRLEQYQQPTKSQLKNARKNRDVVNNVSTTTTTSSSSTTTTDSNNSCDDQNNVTTSPQQSYTNTSEDFSSSNTEVSSIDNVQSVDNSMEQQMINMDYFSIIDETFWEASQFDDTTNYDHLMNSNMIMEENNQNYYGEINNNGGPANYGDDNLEFWLDVFVQAGGAPELPDF